MNRIDENNHEYIGRIGRRRRIEDFGIEFSGGHAVGWAFDVSEFHRENLDILYVTRIDKEKSTDELKVYKKVWARGIPPVLSFSEGSIFYEPPGPREMPWNDAIQTVERSVQILTASSDQESSRNKSRVNGNVKCVIKEYEFGKIKSEGIFEMTQREFEYFLRTGSFSDTKSK